MHATTSRHIFVTLTGRRVSYTQSSMQFAGGSLVATRHDGSKDVTFYFLNAYGVWEVPPYSDTLTAAKAVLFDAVAN